MLTINIDIERESDSQRDGGGGGCLYRAPPVLPMRVALGFLGLFQSVPVQLP